MKKNILSGILALGLIATAQIASAQEVKAEILPATEAPQKHKHDKRHHFKKHNRVQAVMWRKSDINNDGKISRSEALAVASESFDNRDLDKDGFVTKEESQKFYQKKMKKHQRHKVKTQ